MNVTVTISSSCTPTMHAEGCGHLARVRRRRDYVTEYVVKDAESLTEVSQDYWSDIISSDSGLALDSNEALDLAEEFLTEFEIGPCVKLPSRTW